MDRRQAAQRRHDLRGGPGAITGEVTGSLRGQGRPRPLAAPSGAAWWGTPLFKERAPSRSEHYGASRKHSEGRAEHSLAFTEHSEAGREHSRALRELSGGPRRHPGVVRSVPLRAAEPSTLEAEGSRVPAGRPLSVRNVSRAQGCAREAVANVSERVANVRRAPVVRGDPKASSRRNRSPLSRIGASLQDLFRRIEKIGVRISCGHVHFTLLFLLTPALARPSIRSGRGHVDPACGEVL